MMHEPMAEIRFPLRRRSAQTTPSTSAPADPLSEMAARIQELDGAAERVAAGIGAAARSLRGPAATGSAERTELLTGLASALVERTDEIRSDCSRLSAMMERTAKLITERDPEPAADPEHAALAAVESGPEPEEPGPRWIAGEDESELPSIGGGRDVRAIAAQMASAGSTRGEIERHLRVQYGVRDADQALDEIFGDGRHRQVG